MPRTDEGGNSTRAIAEHVLAFYPDLIQGGTEEDIRIRSLALGYLKLSEKARQYLDTGRGDLDGTLAAQEDNRV